MYAKTSLRVHIPSTYSTGLKKKEKLGVINNTVAISTIVVFEISPTIHIM